jgi:hypothetical protein
MDRLRSDQETTPESSGTTPEWVTDDSESSDQPTTAGSAAGT